MRQIKLFAGERPAKRTKYDFQSELIVLVGDTMQRFVPHKSLICKSSDFFAASVSGEWKEAQDNIVHLKDCTPETFAVYNGWLYTGEVDLFEEDESKLPWKDKKGVPLTQRVELTRRAIDCYCLGDMILDHTFANAVIDELLRICEKCETIPSDESINYAWGTLPHDSNVLDLLAELYATEMELKDFNTIVTKLPAEFVAKVAKAGVRDRKTNFEMRRPMRKLRCHYHVHKSNKENCTSERCKCTTCWSMEEGSSGL